MNGSMDEKETQSAAEEIENDTAVCDEELTENNEALHDESNVNAKENAEKNNEEVEVYISRLQRLQADYENLRRRSQKEKQEISQITKETLIYKILPVIDNFERAIQAFENENTHDEALKDGIQMVFRQMMDILKSEGLEPICSIGEAFDLNKHEAMMQVETDAVESNRVVEELQKGYMLHAKVIRPAKVTVAK